MTDLFENSQALSKRIHDTIGAEIGEALAGTWTVLDREQTWGCTIENEQGHRLFIRDAGSGVAERGKITVYARLPEGGYDHIRYDEKGWKDQINVAASKSPAIIAKEIERRLMPDYLPVFAMVTERMSIATNNRNQRDTVGAELAAMWKGSQYYGPPDQDQRGTHRAHMEGKITYPHNFAGYGEIELYHDGSKAEVSLRGCPIETVRKIVAVLAEDA